MLLPLRERLRCKRLARTYALAHHIPVPRHFNAAFPGVGQPARELYRRIQAHAGIAQTGVADFPTRRLIGAVAPEPHTQYGVDVSNYQPRVDWTSVRKSGATFAILKATEGQTFRDPYYEAHRAQANAAGIIVGAYHFARPTRSSGSEQAAFFWGQAKPKAGDVVPVLDFEVGDGASPDHLVAFVKDFSAGIHARSGRLPIIYTYPAFWRSDVVNTREFADHPLWIANYGVARPDVPGGWTGYDIWQFTSDGLVHGIAGRVDRNLAPRGVDHLCLP